MAQNFKKILNSFIYARPVTLPTCDSIHSKSWRLKQTFVGGGRLWPARRGMRSPVDSAAEFRFLCF